MPAVSINAPPSAIRWIAAVAAADFRTDAQLPMGIGLHAGATSVVVIDAAGTSMLINTAGTYFVAPVQLGAVVGTAVVLYGG